VGRVKAPLNLASRPARNERLPALLFASAALLVVGVSVWHGFLVRELASTAATTLDDEVARLEGEQAELRTREQTLRATSVNAAETARWALLKGLVDQRSFSWTGLLARLETALPGDVRIVGISPGVEKGRLGLELDTMARTASDGVSLVKSLEDLPDFEEVFLTTLTDEKEGARCHYRMVYKPEVLRAAAPAAEAQAKAEAAEVTDDRPAEDEAEGGAGT
jgi:hypothetical protein